MSDERCIAMGSPGVVGITGARGNVPDWFIPTVRLEDIQDRPIVDIEKDRKRILQYELIGLSESDVTVEIETINKTKQTFMNVKGNYEDGQTGFKNDINIRLPIDRAIYANVTWKVSDGILTIVLFEVLNLIPFFGVEKVGAFDDQCE